ncbi:MAG: PspC domain-containing protein [Acidimicrobiales bacterium]
MSEESTTDDTTQELPPAPPPGDPIGPRRLRRSNDDRMIAGVSGGIADYFGIDPIIVRLAFVALALLGGSGIGLYLIAWLVMPHAHEDESMAINALRGGHRPGGRAFLAVGLLLVGIVVLSGSLFWLPLGDGLFLPLLILAAGIALLVWPADGTDWHDRWHRHDAEWRSEREAVRSEWRRERDEWRESRHQWRHGYRQGVQGQGVQEQGVQEQGVQPEGATDAPAPARPPRSARRRPRPAPFLGPIGLALLLAFAGLTVFADRVGWWSTDPAAFFAICLMVIGVVLVVSAFAGRARGLIWLGLLLLPIAWAVAAVDLTWWDGVGEELITVDSLDELADEYRWGVGQLHIDLGDLDLDGEDRDLAIGLTVGELKIWVPDTLGVDIDLDGRLGSVIVSDHDLRLNDDGVDVALERSVGDPAGGTLHLDVDLGIGEAEVIVCGGGTIPCP